MRAGGVLLIPAYPILAVVQLATQQPGVLHQVTLRPDKVTGDIIRLGETPGDEANGWIRLGDILVIANLGKAVKPEIDGQPWTCEPE